MHVGQNAVQCLHSNSRTKGLDAYYKMYEHFNIRLCLSLFKRLHTDTLNQYYFSLNHMISKHTHTHIRTLHAHTYARIHTHTHTHTHEGYTHDPAT